MNWLAHSGDDSLRCSTGVCGINVYAHANRALWREKVRVDGAERLTQHHIGAAVQEPEWLCVAFHRHRRRDALFCALGDGDAHPFGEGAPTARIEKLDGVLVFGRLLWSNH